MRVLSAVPALALLCANVLLFGQSITLTGYVTKVDARRGETPFCGCAVNDSVSATIELRTFFAAPPGLHRPALSVYPLTTSPPEVGLTEYTFSGNSFRLQIGDHLWTNRFSRKKGQSGELQLSRPLGGDKTSPTFTSLFSNGFWADRISTSGDIISQGEDVIFIDVDSRPNVLWNTTGEPIPAFDVMPMDKAPILKGGSVLQLRNSPSFESVVVTITKISASPNKVSEVSSNSLKEAIADADREDASHNRTPPPSPYLPPTNPHNASAQYVLSNSFFNPCQLMQQEMSGFSLNLASVYEEDAVVAKAFESRIAALLAMLPPTACAAKTIYSLMAAHGKEGRRLQSGAQSSISKSTSDQLNKQFGKNLMPREWGRALEALKKGNLLSPNFHGDILSNGDYVGTDGHNYGNIADYLP